MQALRFSCQFRVIKMGRRDYRHREPKKNKKTEKKTQISTVLPTSVTVEVVGKQKKRRAEGVEEEQ